MKDFTPFFTAADMVKQTVEGNVERYIRTGEHLQVVEYHFPPNKSFPAHKHDTHEQMGYVVSGRICLEIGGEERELGPGDWYHAPIGVEHRAWTLDGPATMLDIFSPPREDL